MSREQFSISPLNIRTGSTEGEAGGTVSYQPATWMQDLDTAVLQAQDHKSAEGDGDGESLFAQQLSMNTLAMVGTHDSATDKITENSGFSPDKADMKKSLPGFTHGVTKSIVCDWAKCQSRGLLQQLSDGVRYLDIRVAPRLEDVPEGADEGHHEPGARIVTCSPESLAKFRGEEEDEEEGGIGGLADKIGAFFGGTPEAAKPERKMIRMWTAHGQYSETLLSCSQQIQTFMKQSHQQPSAKAAGSPYAQEVVFFDIQHTMGFNQYADWLPDEELHNMVLEALKPMAEHLIPGRGEDATRNLQDPCSFQHTGGGHSNPTPLDLLSMPLCALWEWNDVRARKLITPDTSPVQQSSTGRGGVIVVHKNHAACNRSLAILGLGTASAHLNVVHHRHNMNGRGAVLDSHWFNVDELPKLRAGIVEQRALKSTAAADMAKDLPKNLLGEHYPALQNVMSCSSFWRENPSTSVSYLYDTAQRLQRPMNVSQSVMTPGTESVVKGILGPGFAVKADIEAYATAGNAAVTTDFRDYFLETISAVFGGSKFREYDNSYRNVLMLDFYEIGTCSTPWGNTLGGSHRELSTASTCIELNIVPYLEMIRQCGAKCAIDVPPGFSGGEYISLHPDLQDAVGGNPDREGWARTHYLDYGRNEGRAYSRVSLPYDFNGEVYIGKYPDLAAAVGGNPDRNGWAANHWLQFGVNESRRYL